MSQKFSDKWKTWLGQFSGSRLWDATEINKESRSAKGEGDGEVSWRARQREMKVGTLSHSCQQFLMQTLLLIGRDDQVVPPKNFSSFLFLQCWMDCVAWRVQYQVCHLENVRKTETSVLALLTEVCCNAVLLFCWRVRFDLWLFRFFSFLWNVSVL